MVCRLEKNGFIAKYIFTYKKFAVVCKVNEKKEKRKKDSSKNCKQKTRIQSNLTKIVDKKLNKTCTISSICV